MPMRISKNSILDFLTKCQIEKGGYTGGDVAELAKSLPERLKEKPLGRMSDILRGLNDNRQEQGKEPILVCSCTIDNLGDARKKFPL